MAKDFQISQRVATEILNYFRHWTRPISAPTDIYIYDNTQPAHPGASAGATALAVPGIDATDLSDPIFDNPVVDGTDVSMSSAVLTAINRTDDSSPSAGTATWFRLQADGTDYFDGSVGTSGTDATMTTTTITVSDVVSINTLKITMPTG